MFESRTLDALSRVHPAVPVIIFVPAIVAMIMWGLSETSVAVMIGLVVAGYALWTLFEYWLHRLVFHFEPQHGIGARLHWIIHGVHHDHPNDPLRLVMPPSVSVPLALAVFAVMYLIFGSTYAPGLGAGFFAGLPDLRHDPLLPAPLPPPREGSGGCCASATCATTSRTTRGASESARHTGTRSSKPRPRPSAPRIDRDLRAGGPAGDRLRRL